MDAERGSPGCPGPGFVRGLLALAVLVSVGSALSGFDPVAPLEEESSPSPFPSAFLVPAAAVQLRDFSGFAVLCPPCALQGVMYAWSPNSTFFWRPNVH